MFDSDQACFNILPVNRITKRLNDRKFKGKKSIGQRGATVAIEPFYKK